MSRCQFKWVDSSHLKLTGVIDEGVSFVEEAAKFPAEVWVDFSAVTRINSCGVREWTSAIQKSKARLHYVACPAIIVEQFSMVPEFLGNNNMVDSFFSHYACDSCGNEEDKMLTVGKDIQPGQAAYDEGPAHTCSKCKAAMEFDHNPEIYLHFLKKVKSAA